MLIDITHIMVWEDTKLTLLQLYLISSITPVLVPVVQHLKYQHIVENIVSYGTILASVSRPKKACSEVHAEDNTRLTS